MKERLKRLLRIEDGSLNRRLAEWAALAAILVFGVHYFDLGHNVIPERYFGAKLTYLSVALALGMFQYRLFFEIMQKQVETINNPEWIALRQRFRNPGSVQQAVLADWARQLEARDAIEAQLKSETLTQILPYNVSMISNIFAIVAALLLSVSSDVARMLNLVDDSVWSVRALSVGLLGFSFMPVAESLARYVFVFRAECRIYQDFFSK